MEFKPLSGREYPRFSAVKTFFRLPVAELDGGFDVALFGVPFDGGVSYRPGARFAPSSVREISSLGRGFHWSRAENLWAKKNFADFRLPVTMPMIEGVFFPTIASKSRMDWIIPA